MHRFVFVLFMLVGFPACATQPFGDDPGMPPVTQAELPPPNIVIFLVDDMGWNDTQMAWHPGTDSEVFWTDWYRTPNLRALANHGVICWNAYAASPVCSPTRVALITGQHPARTGVTDWIGHAISQNDQLRSPEWTEQGLQPGDGNITLPQVLSDAGYLTAHVGKAHFGSGPGADPTNLGFDINIGGSHVGSPRGRGEQGAYFAPFPESVHPGMGHHPAGTYITNALTQDAIDVIDRAVDEGRPFFLHLAHYAVHTPIAGQGDPAFLDHYPENMPAVERHYAAMVESMDESLGALIAHLDANGLAENTFIIFTSDNGGLSNHTRANTDDPDDPWARDWHNAPVFSGKGSGYEGGVRVPFVMGWAGAGVFGDEDTRFPSSPEMGLGIKRSIITMDIFPTVLSVARVENPLPAHLRDGESLVSLFDEVWEERRYMFWHYPHQWYNAPQATREAGIRPFSAIIDDDEVGGLKLVYFYSSEGGEVELYDHEDDIGERNNLVADPKYRAFLEIMAENLLLQLERTDAALPIDKATGETVDISNLLEAAGR